MAKRHVRTYGVGTEWNGRTIVDLIYKDGTRPCSCLSCDLCGYGEMAKPYGKNEALQLVWNDGEITDYTYLPTDSNRERILAGKKPLSEEDYEW